MELFPKQIAVGDNAEVIFGNGFTVIKTVFVLKQPTALTPVTVYIVVTIGDNVTAEPTVNPGFQV